MGFKRGFKAVEKEKERRETEATKSRGRLWRLFFPKDTDSKYVIPVTFLTGEPINYNEHQFQRAGKVVQIMCTADEHGEGCKHCSHDKPSFKSAWLVFDHRPYEVEERDAKGNKTGKKITKQGNCKVHARGLTDATLLEKREQKHGLVMNKFEVYRTGTGTKTVWNYDYDGETDITLKDIISSLPDELRTDEFKTKGKIDFYKILEFQILSSAEDDEEEEEAQSDYEDKMKSRLRDTEDDDEDDEEETPKRSTKKKAPASKAKAPAPKASTKPSIKPKTKFKR